MINKAKCPVVMPACRLYSSAHFNDTFPAHTPPEILNTSLEGLVLLMKAMHVDKVSTPPLHVTCVRMYTHLHLLDMYVHTKGFR